LIDSETFITAEDKVVKIWNINKLDCLSQYEGATNNTCIKFSKSEPNYYIFLGNDRVI